MRNGSILRAPWTLVKTDAEPSKRVEAEAQLSSQLRRNASGGDFQNIISCMSASRMATVALLKGQPVFFLLGGEF